MLTYQQWVCIKTYQSQTMTLPLTFRPRSEYKLYDCTSIIKDLHFIATSIGPCIWTFVSSHFWFIVFNLTLINPLQLKQLQLLWEGCPSVLRVFIWSILASTHLWGHTVMSDEMSGSQSLLKLLLNMFYAAELRTLCRTMQFLRTKLCPPCFYRSDFVTAQSCWNRKGSALSALPQSWVLFLKNKATL